MSWSLQLYSLDPRAAAAGRWRVGHGQAPAEPGPAASSPMQPHLTLKDLSGKKGWEPERDTQTSKRWAHQNMAPNKETQRGRELGKKDVRGTNKI